MEYKINQIIKGTIQNIKNYGLFIDFDNKVGFCHISNISNKFIKNISDYFEIGQIVNAKIIEIKDDKIALSIKDAIEEKPINNPSNFEDMLNNFLKVSDEKINSVNRRNKKYNKNKRW